MHFNFLLNYVIFINLSASTHPEALAHEGVDDGVEEAVGHGEPVTRQVAVYHGVELRLGAVGDDALVQQELEQLQREPTDAVQQDHGQHHLDDLREKSWG